MKRASNQSAPAVRMAAAPAHNPGATIEFDTDWDGTNAANFLTAAGTMMLMGIAASGAALAESSADAAAIDPDSLRTLPDSLRTLLNFARNLRALIASPDDPIGDELAKVVESVIGQLEQKGARQWAHGRSNS